ncbi:MAG: methyltransferase domain-containing protein [Candidatus Methanoperedens sp.]|nr:methyltransferase domain-containing protein [Candidatus Methanoperedens sp.]
MNILRNVWKEFSDKFGGTWYYWNSLSGSILLIKEIKRVLSKYVKKDYTVLDVGAGRLFYRDIIKVYTNNYKSMDFKKTHTDIDYIGTTSNIPLQNKTVDVIFCSQVLEHVPDPFETLKEFNRVLKTEGIAIITVPFLSYLHNEPYDFFRYTRYSLNKMSVDNGFEVLELKEIGGFFSFLGYIIGTFLISISWRIPVVNWIIYCINYLIQIFILILERIIETEKIFPFNYSLVIKKCG